MEAAVRLAIAGNLLDVGAKTQLEEDELPKAFENALTAPLVGSVSELEAAISQAQYILFLADNAGEIVFDRWLLTQLPLGRFTVVVRGSPVLNDATLADAQNAELDDFCDLISNGSDAPGTPVADCSAEFRERFAAADLVIAKGQGNYESLAGTDKNIFFLFTIKCSVVSRILGAPIGSLVLHHQRPGDAEAWSRQWCIGFLNDPHTARCGDPLRSMKQKASIRIADNEGAGGTGTPRPPLPGLSLAYYPNPVLRATCQPVDRYDTELRDLAQEMRSLMRFNAGIGLAGPQVSVERRLLVCEIEGRQLSLTNPKILTASKPGEFVEGCLSLPGVQISVTRPERIQVVGYDLRGRKIRFGATGLWARVIQHEMDHLEGVLICDRGRPPAQPCGPCSQALPAVLIAERKRRSRPNQEG